MSDKKNIAQEKRGISLSTLLLSILYVFFKRESKKAKGKEKKK